MNRKLNVAGSLLFILYIVAAVFLAFVVEMLDILPGKYICLFGGVLAVITIILAVIVFKRNARKGVKIFGIVLSLICIAVYIVGGIYLYKTGSFFEEISDNGKDLVEYVVVADADSSMEGLEDLNGKTVNITSELGEEYITAQQKLTSKAEKNSVSFEYAYDTDTDTLLNNLTSGTSEAAFLKKGTYDIYCDDNSDIEEGTKIIYTVSVEKESNSTAKSVDVTKDCYNIYITGLDTTGTIDVESRSDVNMIVTVNPQTKQILLTSIPRDYYVMVHTAQQMDKLTHTGIDGADETVSTVEDLMGCDINYYFKCNFSTVVALIDAIGGITVNSDYTFTTHGRENEGYYFTEGENQLDGASALAFARERKSFSDGDHQRIKDQQLVLEATFKKVSSSTTLLKSYSSILGSISDYMETNFTDEELKQLVKMQLDDMAEWDITKISLEGESSTQPCYAAGNAYASVIMQDQESIDEAKAAMAQVYAGEKVVVSDDDDEEDDSSSDEEY